MNYSLCLSEDRYSQKTRTIQVDFTDGHSIYPAIAEELQGLEIGILGNGTLEKQREIIMKFFYIYAYKYPRKRVPQICE